MLKCFDTKESPVFTILKFYTPEILKIGLILFPVTPSVINNQYQPLSMNVFQMFSTSTIANILLLIITLIEILPSVGHMPTLVLIVILYSFMVITVHHRQHQNQQQQQQLASLTNRGSHFDTFIGSED